MTNSRVRRKLAAHWIMAGVIKCNLYRFKLVQHLGHQVLDSSKATPGVLIAAPVGTPAPLSS